MHFLLCVGGCGDDGGGGGVFSSRICRRCCCRCCGGLLLLVWVSNVGCQQKEVTDMIANAQGSAAFEKFVDRLGERVVFTVRFAAPTANRL